MALKKKDIYFLKPLEIKSYPVDTSGHKIRIISQYFIILAATFCKTTSSNLNIIINYLWYIPNDPLWVQY